MNEGQRPLRLAIYDMDRTITWRGTYSAFLIHAAARLAPWRLALVPVAAIAALGVPLRLVGRSRFKEIAQALVLGPIAPARLKPVAESFADRTMRLNIRADALARIAADRDAGWRIVLATASYRLYVEAIAARLGIADIIATNCLTGPDDRILARIHGENCYGEAKLRMIQAWLEAEGLRRDAVFIRFYSDHASDAPVLDYADEPFAVSPHDRLRTLAAERGWPMLDWR